MSRHRDLTVTDWYKQDIYNRSEAKIGDVKDVLVGPNGQINAVIVGVGGFLGAGEKDVAVNFNSIKQTMKDNKVYLTMDTTKDALRNAPGFRYDSTKTSWVPESRKLPRPECAMAGKSLGYSEALFAHFPR